MAARIIVLSLRKSYHLRQIATVHHRLRRLGAEFAPAKEGRINFHLCAIGFVPGYRSSGTEKAVSLKNVSLFVSPSSQ